MVAEASHIAYDPSTDAPLSPIVVTDALGMINKADGMMQMCMKGCLRGAAGGGVFWPSSGSSWPCWHQPC